MRLTKSLVSFLFFVGLFVTGFQCASTELTSAKLYIQQKNYDKALEVLKKDTEKNPNSDEGFYLLGVIYGEKEMYQEMTESFNKSLAISNKYQKNISDLKLKNWADLFNKGVTFFQRGTKTADKDSVKMYYAKSQKAYEDAILVQPDSGITYRNLAFAYLAVGNNEGAVKPLQTLIEKDIPASIDGYKYLGEIYYTQGQNFKEEYLTSKNSQDSVKAQESFNKAISLLEVGVKKYPEDGELLATLSNSYVGANRLSVAMDAFKLGIEREPSNPVYRYNYGVVLLNADQYEQAIEQFKKALELKSDYLDATYNAAVAYVKWGTAINKEAEAKGLKESNYKEKYTEALPYLEKVVEVRKDEIAIWELLGKVYTILGKTDQATNAFSKADELRK